jgi:glutamate---cysteine ligase / carboxylate-amine ligase
MLNFNPSESLTIGIELELQLINPKNFDMAGRAKELIRTIRASKYEDHIKPELTQSMIEINSSIHKSISSLYTELNEIGDFLSAIAKQSEILMCGGGTHPFQRWSSRKIFPTWRFKNLSKQYGYLAKRFTVFALHMHIGCSNGDDAIYLTHILSKYIPQLIAISASSPFYQDINTGYHSTRVNVVNAFPLSGCIPYITHWRAFSEYFNTMRQLNIISGMKDFYWDIRPKPAFGTVEIRICDSPLTIYKTAIIAAYIQTLAKYLLSERPYPLTPDLYLAYNYNRFQASRFGFDGDSVDPYSKKHLSIGEDILVTLQKMMPHAHSLQTHHYLSQLENQVKEKQNDASYLIEIFNQMGTLKKVVQKQCQLWMGENYFQGTAL